jgi:glycosyltransferase involved in cell wall biosynthesis
MISFVVPAYNEERLLARTLTAIHDAARTSGEPYEILVVDDASTDATAEIARGHGARVVVVHFRQIARTRNAGARAAAGEILIFVDADTRISEETVRATIRAVRAGAVGGGADVRFDGALPLWAVVTLPILGVVMRAQNLAAGCYLFCSRTAFDRTGGFDETLFAAEEIYFSRALALCGPVVILREAVLTSGRKLRSHSGWDVLRLIAGFLRRGTDVVRNRDRLSLWYGERQHDREEMQERNQE